MVNSFNKQRLFDNIAFLVKKHDLKIGELETSSGVSPGYISRTSKEGGPTPGIEFIVNVARELKVSVDTLLYVELDELTPTEQYIVDFIKKLESDTFEDNLDWNRESAESLKRVGTDSVGYPNHRMFRLETFSEETESGYSAEITACRFVSNSFDVHTSICGDCFNLHLRDGVYLYLMNISKSVYQRGDISAFAKEVWIYGPSTEKHFLCRNGDDFIGHSVENLYDAVCEKSKYPKIAPELKKIIDAYMMDDLISDEDDCPF